MPVSFGLQKFFDSQQKKKSKREMQKRFQDLGGDINPAFMQSFEVFHDKIMSIVDENPEQADMIASEVDALGADMSKLQKHHDTARKHKLLNLI